MAKHVQVYNDISTEIYENESSFSKPINIEKKSGFLIRIDSIRIFGGQNTVTASSFINYRAVFGLLRVDKKRILGIKNMDKWTVFDDDIGGFVEDESNYLEATGSFNCVIIPERDKQICDVPRLLLSTLNVIQTSQNNSLAIEVEFSYVKETSEKLKELENIREYPGGGVITGINESNDIGADQNEPPTPAPATAPAPATP